MLTYDYFSKILVSFIVITRLVLELFLELKYVYL